MIGTEADTLAARLERALTENEQLQASRHAAHGMLREAARRLRFYGLIHRGQRPPHLERAERDEAMAGRIETLLGQAPAVAVAALLRDGADA